MSTLNPAQRQAVQHPGGPLLVLAGAGTGKTRVVTCRIAQLIRRGAPADRILAVTFTNKAAREMLQRVSELLRSSRSQPRPSVSTFHSHCVKILRRHIRRLGYPERFAIYARGEQESVARRVLREIRVHEAQLRPGDLLNMIGRWKSQSLSPAAAVSQACRDVEHLAASAYRRYQQALRDAGAVDFDDLLLCTVQLLEQHDDVRQQEAGLFDHLLVDEYQDTNASQYQIIRCLAQPHRNLCVVGDDDQSIYGWRGAEVQHILRFQRDWPDAAVVRLEDNYRSTEAILTLANRLISYNSHRHDKVLRAARGGGEQPRIDQHRNEQEEAQAVTQDIKRKLAQPGVEPRDFAILFRTNEQPRVFETELRKADIPYVLIGSRSFFDRREVRDVTSYLRVLETPEDETALRRIINVPPRGLSSKSIQALTDEAVRHGGSLWEQLQRAGQVPGLSAAARGAAGRLVRLVQSLQRRLPSHGGRESLVDVARDLLAKVDYRGELQRYPDAQEQESRWNSVEEIINALGAYERGSRSPQLGEFLDELMLGDREDERDKEQQLRRNGVALMTLHSAKGLEFSQVYMVGLEEGILPHHRSVELEGEAIDEERRLCYVGVTRAQDRLTLSLPLSRMKWGKPRDTKPSRFLFELIGQAERVKG